MRLRNLLRIGLCLAMAHPGVLCAAPPDGVRAAAGPQPPPDLRADPANRFAAPPIPRAVLRQLPGGCLQTWPASTRLGGEMPPAYLIDAAAAVTAPAKDRTAAAATMSQPPSYLGSTSGRTVAPRVEASGVEDSRGDDRGKDDRLEAYPTGDTSLLLAPVAEGDALLQMAPAASPAEVATPAAEAEDPHHELLLEHAYPSAQTCAACHPRQYDQWRVSAHAYAVVSPMFQRFEQLVSELTHGTVGYFCVRCHAPVATQLDLPRETSVLDAPPIFQEGITCIACHRVREAYGRTNGLRRIEPGDIYQPVYGPIGGSGVAEAIAHREALKLKIDPHDTGPGQPMHAAGRYFEPITRSDFCASCHQVAVHPGIGLEVVHAQYRSGPAAAKGISCQDCHMGTDPGKPHGYAFGPVAQLAGKPWGEDRKQSNHTFWGPSYSIAHPGIFPHNAKPSRWTARQWVTFDYRAGWGTEAFERGVPPGAAFPPPWDNGDDRRDARRIIDANLQRASEKRASAIAVMEAGSRIQGPLFDAPPRWGAPLRFRYRVANISEGHNLPSGSLGAQPQVWLNVALVGPGGRRLWESGYLDPQGDLADLHSRGVALGVVPRDAQLFNLQTKFLINNVKGTDREAALPLNFSLDQLAFFRPGAVPVSVLNHPPLIRMEAHSIAPLGSRDAVYRIPADVLATPGAYRLSVRLRHRLEPNHFMRQVGSSPEMIRRMNEGILDIHPQSHTFQVR